MEVTSVRACVVRRFCGVLLSPHNSPAAKGQNLFKEQREKLGWLPWGTAPRLGCVRSRAHVAPAAFAYLQSPGLTLLNMLVIAFVFPFNGKLVYCSVSQPIGIIPENLTLVRPHCPS